MSEIPQSSIERPEANSVIPELRPFESPLTPERIQDAIDDVSGLTALAVDLRPISVELDERTVQALLSNDYDLVA